MGKPGLRLFRLFGIDVYLHWAWIIVAVIEIEARPYSSLPWNIAEYLSLFATKQNVVPATEDAAAITPGWKPGEPKRFFHDFSRLVLEENLEIDRLEPLDDSAHAVLGYLLGGRRH